MSIAFWKKEDYNQDRCRVELVECSQNMLERGDSFFSCVLSPFVEEVLPAMELREPLQFTENVYLISAEDPHVFNANSYIITGNTNAIIDCGSFEGMDRVERNLSQLSLGLKDIDIIVGTHGHRDHIQSAGLFPNAELWLPERSREPVTKCDPFLTGSYLYKRPFLPVEIQRTFKDGELLDIGAPFPLEVIETPGHSPDTVSFKFGDVLFVGDTVGGGASQKLGSNIFAWKQSLKRLQETEFDIMLSGHLRTDFLPETKPKLEDQMRKFGMMYKHSFGPDDDALASPWP